jgi:hypothetical protein
MRIKKQYVKGKKYEVKPEKFYLNRDSDKIWELGELYSDNPPFPL